MILAYDRLQCLYDKIDAERAAPPGRCQDTLSLVQGRPEHVEVWKADLTKAVAAGVAADLKGNAEYSLERTYAAISAQHGEAQRRYERAVSLEKVQTELVKRERQRLLNGRTTTFQTITFEQNLASSQVQKVKAQLALLQLHNVLKTFTEQQ
jgi:hypothetical protein